MQLLVVVIIYLFSFLTLANPAFEIPRSKVIELAEPATGRVYPIFIKLPRSYASNPGKKYPVIYLTDAMYSFQIASGVTRFPMNIGAIEEAIIVAISYSKGARGQTSRVRDYTPTKAADWKMETGNAQGHVKFLREIVLPYVDQKFRSNPNQRTYVGNSLGGLLGAYILFTNPDMFNSYILGSPSVWFNQNQILAMQVTKSNLPIKVYLSVGSLEQPEFGERENMVAGAKDLAEKILTQSGKNTSLKFHIIDGAKHATAFPTSLIQGLDWLYEKR